MTKIIMPSDENLNMFFDLIKANNKCAVDLLEIMQTDMLEMLNEGAE